MGWFSSPSENEAAATAVAGAVVGFAAGAASILEAEITARRALAMTGFAALTGAASTVGIVMYFPGVNRVAAVLAAGFVGFAVSVTYPLYKAVVAQYGKAAQARAERRAKELEAQEPPASG